MNRWRLIYLLTFLGAAGVSLLLTPLFRILAVRLDFMDRPAANHKGHGQATPLLGGAAMFTSWLLCIFAGFFALENGIFPWFAETLSGHLSGLRLASGNLLFIVAAALLAVLLGLIDDKWALKASWKFLGQFVISVIAVWGGGIRLNIFVDFQPLVIAVTLFWLMLMMNAVNFFDNMDGLAVGTIAIAMAFFTVIAALNRQYFIAIFSALNFGICCGFWYYNASPALLFMGDSGSHFLGFLAAVIAAQVTFFDKSFSLSRFPILLPGLILAVPLFDTLAVVLIRVRNGKPFWIGDHNHISHRFMHLGLSRRSSVMLVHLTALCIALGTLPIFWGDFRTAAVLVIQDILLLFIITFIQWRLKVK